MKRWIGVALLAGATLAHGQATPAKKELVAKLLALQAPGIEAVARSIVERPAVQLMQAAGQALQAQVPPDNREAVWSPDGSLIAFSSERDGDWKIYIMNADLTGLRELASGFSPSWSPDGQFIVFASYREGNDELYVIGVDGSRETQLTFNDWDDNQPDWRP